MTVCIAVGCSCITPGQNPKIIFVSDSPFSLGYTSAEIDFKIRLLAKGWSVMFAGEDSSHASSVIHTAQKSLENVNEVSGLRAATEMAKAYHEVRKVQIENRFLRMYDMTMEEFVAEGKDTFPESHHLNMIYEIERYDLGCQFLAAGFMSDRSEYPCFFTIRNPGEFSPLDDIGYCAIGSGDVNAISYLARRNQDVYRTFPRSLYTAIAAKHLAEKAPGVGKETWVMVQERGKLKSEGVDPAKIQAISAMWTMEEENVEPSRLEERISGIMMGQ